MADTVDTDALASYFSAELGVTVVDTDVLHDGLNLSLAVSTAEDGQAYVLRRPNKFRHRPSFNDLSREFGVLERLRDTAVPAPDPVLLCEDESVLGDPFMVTSYVGGEAVPLGSDLPGRFRTPAARDRYATRLIATLAEVHTLDAAPFAAVCDRTPVRAQVERTVAQFEDATAVTGHEPPGLRRVADWLLAHVPAGTGTETALVHGDYRPANLHVGGTDDPVVVGVLDWETAFLGDPLTELGYLLLRWRDDGDPTPSLSAVRERHGDGEVVRELEATSERGFAPFTAEPGSPTRRELVARYEDRTGFEFEHGRFYRAFGVFMLAAVWADLHRYRTEAGAPSDWEPRIEYLSLVATSIVDGEFPL